MEWHVWLTVDVDLGRCGPQQRRASPGDALKPSSPRLSMQSLFCANHGKSWLCPAPLPPGWLPKRHPCIGTLGVLWWGVHKGWGLPDSLQTCMRRGLLVTRQWQLSYPRTPCGPPRTPETPDSAGALGPFWKSGPGTLGLVQAGPSCLGHPAPGSPSAPAFPSGPHLLASLTSQAMWCCTARPTPHPPPPVCFPGDLHALPIGTVLPPWP